MPRAKKDGNKGGRDNLFLRGNVWYVRFWSNGKEVRRAAGHDRKGAQELLGQLRAAAERGKLGLAKSARSSPTLADYKATYMEWAEAHKRSADRDERSLRFLIPVFGTVRLSMITRASVEKFQRTRLATGIKGSTVNREVACLRKILSHALDAGKIEANPLLRMKMLPESPGRIPVLEPTDENRLMVAALPWLRFMIRMAVGTGARQGELLGLRWRDVDLGNGSITISDSKSGESRRIPIHPALIDELTARKGQPDGWVVTLPDGSCPRSSTVTHAFKDAARAIGRGELRFHDLRHIAGSRLLATGASLPEVAAMLGHKTLAMSKRYSHVSPVRLAGLLATMPVAAEVEDPDKDRQRRPSGPRPPA
jgi:integrase